MANISDLLNLVYSKIMILIETARISTEAPETTATTTTTSTTPSPRPVMRRMTKAGGIFCSRMDQKIGVLSRKQLDQ